MTGDRVGRDGTCLARLIPQVLRVRAPEGRTERGARHGTRGPGDGDRSRVVPAGEGAGSGRPRAQRWRGRRSQSGRAPGSSAPPRTRTAVEGWPVTALS